MLVKKLYCKKITVISAMYCIQYKYMLLVYSTTTKWYVWTHFYKIENYIHIKLYNYCNLSTKIPLKIFNKQIKFLRLWIVCRWTVHRWKRISNQAFLWLPCLRRQEVGICPPFHCRQKTSNLLWQTIVEFCICLPNSNVASLHLRKRKKSIILGINWNVITLMMLC